MNVWDEEPFVIIDPSTPANTVAVPESSRERPTFSSTNSVSSFFFPHTGADESPSRKTRAYNHFTITSSAAKEGTLDVRRQEGHQLTLILASPSHASHASSFLLPLSRLSIAPNLLSPNKDKSRDADKLDPRHSTISRSKPTTPTLSPEVSRQQVSPATTFPPGKNKKHAWVFSKRTVPGSTRKGGPVEAEPDPAQGPNVGVLSTEEGTQVSLLAVTLNQIIQSLTPANTVPRMFVSLRLFTSHLPFL